MFRFLHKIALFFTFAAPLFSGDAIPDADITFLVADIKINKHDGIKICEVQHGILSTYNGDIFCHGGEGNIVKNFLSLIERRAIPCWTLSRDVTERALLRAMERSHNVTTRKRLGKITGDETFTMQAKHPPFDPSSIDSYGALLFAKKLEGRYVELLLKKFPGLLIVDRAAHPYWHSKEKMSRLFRENGLLRAAKPRWGLYEKREGKGLPKKIAAELQAHCFVIKPINEFLGRGVIIVDKNELDNIVTMIIKKGDRCKKHPLPEVRYWHSNMDDAFIVEEFIPSDPHRFEELGGKEFDPTMRVAYLFECSRGETSLHFLGANWFLPSHSLDEKGSLIEKHKGCNTIPYYCPVAEKELRSVREKLDTIMLTLYNAMIKKSLEPELP